MLGSKNNILEIDIKDPTTLNKDKGKMLVHFDRSTITIKECDLTLRFTACNLPKAIWCCGNYSYYLEIFKPMPDAGRKANVNDLAEGFNKDNYKLQDTDWISVYKSETLEYVTKCEWAEFTSKRSFFASGSDDTPLKLNLVRADKTLAASTLKTLAELKRACESKVDKELLDAKRGQVSLTVEKYQSRSLGC